ncbi:hypothetical protein C5167_024130 [Papaver somniferum]|uniref:RRM domain-containing protein n=1 Tax=Papaver somniferum TaxID=3469 RepID=A0A4Y7JNP0_PAPSO|nr:29 kDa ribonucleoprotein A, chloroplastic-like [Papaver somniferum]RZC62347.1 hypothetical protein C5167_024130 [Papaver somniferum]
MAAAAGATLGSCFSATTTTAVTCRVGSSIKQYAPTSDFVLPRIACIGNVRTPSVLLPSGTSSSLMPHSHLLHESFCNISMNSPSQRLGSTFKISATIEQDEVSEVTETLSLADETEEIKDGKTNEDIQEDGAVEVAVSNGDQVPGEEETSSNSDEVVSATNTKLYFGNLPYNCDSAQLAGIIQDYGSPEMVEVLYDRNSGRSRGFAFVSMSSVQDCNAVIENLDGREFGGRTLKVNFSDKPKPKEPLYPETDYKLFVGNLNWSVTSESLIQAFQEYGDVVGARVLYDGDTGRSRGYGFVCYSSKQEMDAALVSLNGMELEGRALRVSLAQGRRN